MRTDCLFRVSELRDKCWYIPDLSKREHMKTLIATALGTAPFGNPKATLVATGLAIIGSLANDMYDEFCDMRTLLCSAAYHFEMENFYNLLSLEFTHKCEKIWNHDFNDRGTMCFLNAVDHLTVAEMLTSCIEEPWIRFAISEHLIYQRKSLLDQLKNNPGKLSKKFSPAAWGFYENIDEITAECTDQNLRMELSGFIENYVWDLENAERHWGIK